MTITGPVPGGAVRVGSGFDVVRSVVLGVVLLRWFWVVVGRVDGVRDGVRFGVERLADVEAVVERGSRTAEDCVLVGGVLIAVVVADDVEDGFEDPAEPQAASPLTAQIAMMRRPAGRRRRLMALTVTNATGHTYALRGRHPDYRHKINIVRCHKARPCAATIMTVAALTLSSCAGHRSGAGSGPVTTTAVPTTSSTPTTAAPTTAAPTTATTAVVVPTPRTTPKAKPAAVTPRRVGPTDAEEDRVDDTIRSLTSYLGTGGVSIKVVDLHDGVTFGYGASGGMRTGSIAKILILETLLLQHQKTHTTLSSAQQALATRMIENSDNDAANALWNAIGATTGVTRTLATLGVHHTIPGTDGYWGLTQTSATDYIALLRNLSGRSILSAASRSYILGLMSHIESDQAWGVSAAADPHTLVRLKNGWLSAKIDFGRWLVNSVGIVTVHGQSLLIAVMTQHGNGFEPGIDLVEKLATISADLVTINP